MALLVKTALRVSDRDLRNDDDLVDRLSHRYTSTMLVIFSIVVSTKQYVGTPIDCWAPVHFKKQHVEYVNNYCWIGSTYAHSFNETMPDADVRSQLPRTTYYQWVPILLLVQALLFNLPCLLWRSLVEHSGLDINSVIVTGRMLAASQMDEDIHEGLLNRMVQQVNRYLGSFRLPKGRVTLSVKHLFSRTCFALCGHRRGNYLLTLFLFVKVLYVLNAVGQLFLLDLFLGYDYHMYGIDVMRAWTRGEDWTGSTRFPRVNMCDFKVRRLGNLHQYTLQCVLPINLFNEKIYLFLWFWLLFVAGVTFFSTLVWALRSLMRIDRTRYIKRQLQLSNSIATTDSEERKKRAVVFVEHHLCQDGIFLIRLLHKATNHITALELTTQLWQDYLRQPMSNGTSDDHKAESSGTPRPPRTPTAPPEKEVYH